MNHCQLVRNQHGDVLVRTYYWAEIFAEHTVKTTLAGIKKIAHFKFCSSSPGAVFVCSASDTPPSKEKKLFFSKIQHGDHNHQMYHLLCHLIGFHYGDNGTFVKKSVSSAPEVHDLVCPMPRKRLSSSSDEEDEYKCIAQHTYTLHQQCII